MLGWLEPMMTLRQLFSSNERRPQEILNGYALDVLGRLFLKWPEVSAQEIADAHERVGLRPPDTVNLDKRQLMTDLVTTVLLRAYPSTPLYMAHIAAKNGVALWRQ
jgi:hypothetical protein